MLAYFQPTPSLEAFNRVVLNIERLVDIGRITTVHELEVALIGAARVRLLFKKIDGHELIGVEHCAIYGALRPLFKTCKGVVQHHVL